MICGSFVEFVHFPLKSQVDVILLFDQLVRNCFVFKSDVKESDKARIKLRIVVKHQLC